MSAATQDELNVYESAEARFETAAKKLDLEDGVYSYLKYPSKEITVYIPVARDIGTAGSFHRVPRAALVDVAGPARAGFDLRPTCPLMKCARWRRG